MNKKLLAAMVVGAAGLAWAAPQAKADPVSIGLQEGGGTITTEITGNGAASVSNISYGTFSINDINAVGTPPSAQPDLTSTSLNVTNGAAGTLVVYVTETDVTGPLGKYNLQSGFSLTTFESPFTSVTEATYIDTGNAAYALTTQLSSYDFTSTSTGINEVATTPDITGEYSITEVFTITASADGGGATVGGSIKTSDVPEPGSLALLGTGLFALGMIGWTRRRRNV